MDEIRDDDRTHLGSADEERSRRRRYARPAVDIHSKENEITVVADVPGMKKSDLDVTVDGDDLVIDGPVAGRQERESELPWGYYRRFRLRSLVDKDRIDASLEAGVLRITLPRSAPEPAKKVNIS